eukprot:2858025-Prymnesium_polylepis.2
MPIIFKTRLCVIYDAPKRYCTPSVPKTDIVSRSWLNVYLVNVRMLYSRAPRGYEIERASSVQLGVTSTGATSDRIRLPVNCAHAPSAHAPSSRNVSGGLVLRWWVGLESIKPTGAEADGRGPADWLIVRIQVWVGQLKDADACVNSPVTLKVAGGRLHAALRQRSHHTLPAIQRSDGHSPSHL